MTFLRSLTVAVPMVNLAATLFLTGLAWSLQVVQLPILRTDQLAAHRRRNSLLMIVPMTIEIYSALWLAFLDQRWPPRIAAFLCAVIGFATVRYSQASQRENLSALKLWNAIRTASWSFRSVLLIGYLLESRNAR